MKIKLIGLIALATFTTVSVPNEQSIKQRPKKGVIRDISDSIHNIKTKKALYKIICIAFLFGLHAGLDKSVYRCEDATQARIWDLEGVLISGPRGYSPTDQEMNKIMEIADRAIQRSQHHLKIRNAINELKPNEYYDNPSLKLLNNTLDHTTQATILFCSIFLSVKALNYLGRKYFDIEDDYQEKRASEEIENLI